VKTRKVDDFGKKIVLYGNSGSGKSTLASLAPSPVFVDLDRGTVGMENVQVIDSVSDFNDLRAAIQQAPKYVPEGGTLVVDTITKVDEFLTNYLKQAHGKKSVKELSYDRFPLATEAFRLLLTDCDQVISAKRNVILCAHAANINVANAEGLDFIQGGPKLTHSRLDSARDEMLAWASYVFHIKFEDVAIVKENEKAKAGKLVNASTNRVIYTTGSEASIAKARPVGGKWLPPVVSYSSAVDDSIWQMLFAGAIPDA
jgi:adenylate kinase family enzyme